MDRDQENWGPRHSVISAEIFAQNIENIRQILLFVCLYVKVIPNVVAWACISDSVLVRCVWARFAAGI